MHLRWKGVQHVTAPASACRWSSEDGEQDQVGAPGEIVLKQICDYTSAVSLNVDWMPGKYERTGQSGASSVLDAERANEAMSLEVRSVCSL